MMNINDLRKELDALAKQIEQYEAKQKEQLEAKQKEQKAPEFLPGDIVLGLNAGRDFLDILIKHEAKSDYPWQCRESSYTEIKHAYIPGIYNRWTGGECPVDGGARLTVWRRDGVVLQNRIAGTLDWVHEFMKSDFDIIAFMIMQEKQDD
jgi:hypothetical protein